MKRILAWVLLVGFLLLIVNIFTVKFFLGPSVMVYILVVVLFLFIKIPHSSSNNKPGKDKT
jgi:hypothetical protein